MSGWLPSTAVQVDTAIIQAGVAHQVAYEHASQGADPDQATIHGTHVGGVTLAWWLFVLLPSLFWTLAGLVIPSAVFWLWVIGLDLGAGFLWMVVNSYRHRPIGSPSPYVLPGWLWVVLWVAWGFAIWPVAVIMAVVL